LVYFKALNREKKVLILLSKPHAAFYLEEIKKVTESTGPPVGVAILAVLNIIVGLFGLFAGITIDFILSGGALTMVGSFQLGTIFIGLFQIVAGYGLWKMKSWAWMLAVAITGIGLIVNLLIVFFDFNQIRMYLLPMLIRIVILAYLRHKPIQSRFL
jgi:hypothetical protein